ncbi:peptidoglycan-binding protein LysM [Campylobacter suis]|uniref:Potassium binding protein Kbp n=1 Tax=Campylobacter suis TaxID=2790657 RepID=A0ABM8Q1J4_9BACT|nr:peptidoglycan-binding protein LysM [Campylobacter suis]CAD7286655.1 Potassium binding protein Kbp [Campylobacter suis]
MGFLSFVAEAGKKLLGIGDDNKSVKDELSTSLGDAAENFEVKVEGDTVKITGDAPQDVKEKAALIAGNVAGIKNVEFDGVEDAEDSFYTIQKGDNLSKIAKQFYGNANKYPKIFEANREVIKDANLIYPGQKIRIPKL